MNKYMQMALDSAYEGIKNKDGGPFGAAIVKNGEVIAVAHNMVLRTNDSTNHAEIVAIRSACKKLNTYDLTGCSIYATGEPCPMCLSAIIWSNIKDIHFGASRDIANDIGFRDKDIYEYLDGKNNINLHVEQIDSSECSKIFSDYKNVIY